MIFDNAGAALSPEADVCIVGAGPVGLALAFKCASRGLSVTVLESGNFDTDAGNQADFGGVDLATRYHASTSLTGHRGIGGTSRLWGGRCVAFDEMDFEARDHVPFSGWPITHADINSYYDEAFAFLGCGDGLQLPVTDEGTDSEISTNLLERWSSEPDLRRLHGRILRTSRRINIHAGCTVMEIALDAEGEKVTRLTARSKGQNFAIRARTYVLAGGGLENTRLLLATQRHWPQKFGGPDGALGRFYTGHVTGYLAAIRFEDWRFAEALWYKKCPDGSHVRRRLALTPEAQRKNALLNTAFWLDSFSISDPGHGSGALSMLYLGLAGAGLYPRIGKGLAPSPTLPKARGHREHRANIRDDPRLLRSSLHIASQLARRLGQRNGLLNPQGRYLLRYHAEQIPDSGNRVRLSERQDASPLPRLNVDFRFLQQDIESVVGSHDVVDRWLQRSGSGRLDYLVLPQERNEHVLEQAIDGYHQLGLTRMSGHRADGVVDRNCRVHDLANLFVAGSSVFPTAGQANPTLPAVALALRLGDHLSRMRTDGGGT